MHQNKRVLEHRYPYVNIEALPSVLVSLNIFEFENWHRKIS